ncbi:PQQ-dependent sugar dehydrogenase [Rhodospirillaceae bacterium SYSU D60014]|uniref:PQQ-dependent sugar dehydrogenase n=1 Tax=Virgifigura deserti TaxID=2268457 RepID=UPI000E667A41
MKKLACRCALSLLLAIPFSGQSFAQNNMEKLQDFRQTGTELEIESIPQDAERIEAIRKNLERIQLPPGFKIDLYAIVPDARHMAVGTNVGVVFVGTRKTKVWAVTDRDKDRVADEVKQFAPSVKFKFPNGPVMSKEGVLYIAGHNRILAFPAAEFFYEGPDVAVAVVKDQFIPLEEEYFNHAFRVLDIGPDGKLYVALGQPYNVFPADKMPMEPLGSIARLNQDGTGWEIYAHGIRNSVGLDFHPVTGELWFNDNQVDGMGDDIPSGELNRAPSPGLNFGFPWYGGGSTRTVEYKDMEPPEGLVFPEIEWQAHAADLGMTFYTGNQFPSSYKNDLFSAQHGSWNRTTPVGAQIMHVDFDEDGNIVSSEVFAKGWLDEETGEYLGRPVDVKQYLDGSLLVSDDLVGAIYRIYYNGESQ